MPPMPGLQPGVAEQGDAVHGDRDDPGQRGVLVDRQQLAREAGAAHHLARHRQPEADRDRHQDQGDAGRRHGWRATSRGSAGWSEAAAFMRRSPAEVRDADARLGGERADRLDPAAVVDEQAAALGEDRATALGAGEERRLGEGLRLDRGVAEGGGADQPGPGRLAGRGVEQVVGVAAVGAAPDPHVEARGGDGAGAELEHEGALARQRVLDEDLVGVDESVGAADADVAAAVDDEARVAAQAAGDQVGREALAGAAGVEADAGRAGDRAGRVVDLEAAPAAPPGWGSPGAAVAPRPARRRAARPEPRPARRRSRRTRSPRPGSGRPGRRCARAAASPALTAVRSSSEAGTRSRGSAFSAHSSLSGLKRDSAASNSTTNCLRLLGRRRCRSHSRPRLADQQAHVAAHRIEDDVVLAHGQEAPVVTGAYPARDRAGGDRAAAGDAGAAGGRDDRGDDAALDHLAHQDRARWRRLSWR